MADLFKSIRNMFLGNSKEDDAKYDPPEGEYLPELDDGFVNPLDSMPIANGSNRYAPSEKIAELESMSQQSEDKEWFNDDIVDTSPSEIQPPGVDEEPPHITIHEKMYRLATARNNPFHVGGSENAQSEIDYVKKHSPWGGGSEKFQGGSERIR